VNGIRRRPLPRPERTNTRVLGYQDVGGEATLINSGSALGKSDVPRFVGVVTDESGARVAGARVWVRDSRDTTTSAADGTFRLPYRGSGLYYVLASDSALAPDGIARTLPTPVKLKAQGTWDVWLTFYPRSDVLPLMCPEKSYVPGTGVLIASIVGQDGEPISGARVEVEARQAIVVRDTVYRTRSSTGVAGDGGRFIVCGAALNEPLTVRATKGILTGTGTVTTWNNEVERMRLVLKPLAPSPFF
jgi:hypothetical protein